MREVMNSDLLILAMAYDAISIAFIESMPDSKYRDTAKAMRDTVNAECRKRNLPCAFSEGANLGYSTLYEKAQKWLRDNNRQGELRF